MSTVGLVILFLAGCAGGGSPIEPSAGEIPGLTELREASYIGHERQLLGFWNVEFKAESGEFEAIPLRQAEFHLNVVKWFNNPDSMGIAIVDANIDAGEFTLDITLNHPFPDSIYRGFDVKGIVFGNGPETYGSKDDPDIMWFKPDGFRLTNADGWTRWWNPIEFTTPGLFGYSPGLFGTGFEGQTTLNPYKYFATALSATDPVVPSVSSENRGTFATDGGPVTRRYELQFPLVGGNPSVKFQYAIDANWAPPIGGGSIPSIDYFPPGANSPEAFHIEIDASESTVFYYGEDSKGGDVVLDIQIFDWGAPNDPAGIDGEIEVIRLESPTLFDQVVEIPLDSEPGFSALSGIYHVTVPDVHPSGYADQEVLLTVLSKYPDSYEPPAPGIDYPDEAELAAYAMATIPVRTIDLGQKGTIETNGIAVDVETREYFSYILDTSGLEIVLVIDPLTTIPLKTVTLGISPVALDVENDFAYVIDTSGNFLVIDVNPIGDASIVHSFTMSETLTSIDVDGPYAYIGGSSGNLSIIDISPPQSASVINSVPMSGTGQINDIKADNGYAYVATDGLEIFDVIPPLSAASVKVVSTSTSSGAVDVSGNGYAFVGNSSDELLTIDISPPDSAMIVDTLSLTSTINDIDFQNGLINVTVSEGSLQVAYFDPYSEEAHLIGEEGSLTNPGELSVEHNLAYVVDEGLISIIGLWADPNGEMPLELLDPNGGEAWAVGSDHEIIWVPMDLPGTLDIEYSKDYFVSDINVIATDVENNGIYTWFDIPDDPSDTVRIRISSTDLQDLYDESDADFSIVKPWLEVGVPDGGEIWTVGTDEEILWSYEDIPGPVFIEYSKDNFGSDINIITSDENNDGSFIWTDIPDDPSDTVLVRISSTEDPGIFDLSDDYFSIVAPPEWIKVETPDGGEIWTSGTDEEILWSYENVPGPVFIEYSKDNFGSDLNTIASDEINDGSYTWSPIPFDPSDTVRVRVSSTNIPSVYDESDEDFSIVPPSEWIHVNSPNGGEIWSAETDEEITWTSQDVTGTVYIQYSKDGFAADFHTIAVNEPNDGSFMWMGIPNDPSVTVRVRVTSTDDPGIFDTSDDDFSILSAPAWIKVTQPNGGEEWTVGNDWEIIWNSDHVTGTIFIQYSKDNFIADVNTITLDETNDGSYLWTDIPDDQSETVRVRISSTDDPGVSDISDAYFSIVQPWFSVLIPNGSEDWTANTNEEIAWVSDYVTGTVFIEYSKDNFVSDIHEIATDETNDGSCTWYNIPDDPSETVRVRISSTDDPSVNDISNQDFTILPPTDSGWGLTLGGIGEDTGYSIAVDDDGSLYMSGALHYDALLRKYDSTGSLEWSHLWGGGGNLYIDRGECVDIDNSGNVWVAGAFIGTDVDFDPGSGTASHSAYGDFDCFLSKFDTDGNFLWAGTWGHSNDDFATGVAVAESGNVYVTGYFTGDVDFDPDDIGETWGSASSGHSVYLSKFNSSCEFQWVRIFCDGEGFYQNVSEDIAVDFNENVYVVGGFIGSGIDFDPGTGTDNHDSFHSMDSFLTKFDSSGNHQWALTWGGMDGSGYQREDVAYGVVTDSVGQLYVTGTFVGLNVDLNPDPGLLETDFHDTVGEGDSFLSMFDSSGNFLWAGTWGGADNDVGNGIAVDSSQFVYVTGNCSGTTDFDPDPVDEEIRGVGSQHDIFLSTFDSSGDFQWVRVFGTTSSPESGYGVATYGSGCIYTTGCFIDGTVDLAPHEWPCDEDPSNHPSSGQEDIFLTKHLANGCW